MLNVECSRRFFRTPLSPSLSPLVPHGERVTDRAPAEVTREGVWSDERMQNRLIPSAAAGETHRMVRTVSLVFTRPTIGAFAGFAEGIDLGFGGGRGCCGSGWRVSFG